MTELTDRQRRFIGWIVSIFFNTGLLAIGAIWLVHPARFQVEVAKSSTEIDLAAESPASTPPPVSPDPVSTPPPVPAVAPATPAQPVEPLPLPPNEPAVVPAPAKIETPVVPQPAVAPSPPPKKVPAKPHTPHSSTMSKPSPVRETSQASQGATNAHPDELHNEPPEYPEESRLAREQGTVLLRVEVTAGGQAMSVSIRQSSGHPRLDQAARKAVRQWRFHPATTAGISVSSEVDVPVRFKLE